MDILHLHLAYFRMLYDISADSRLQWYRLQNPQLHSLPLSKAGGHSAAAVQQNSSL